MRLRGCPVDRGPPIPTRPQSKLQPALASYNIIEQCTILWPVPGYRLTTTLLAPYRPGARGRYSEVPLHYEPLSTPTFPPSNNLSANNLPMQYPIAHHYHTTIPLPLPQTIQIPPSHNIIKRTLPAGHTNGPSPNITSSITLW